MATEFLTLILVAWAIGLLTVPAWVFFAGWVAARARTEMEAPHRHPQAPREVFTASRMADDR